MTSRIVFSWNIVPDDDLQFIKDRQEIMTKLLFKIACHYCNYYSDIVVNEIAHPVLKSECM